MRRIAIAALGAVIAVALTSGCTAGPAPTASPTGVLPLVPATHPHVQLSCPLTPAMHYDPEAPPADEVTAAYECTAEPWTDAPDGTPQTVQYVDRIAQEQLAGLLAVYATPDEREAPGSCSDVRHDPLIVWLHRGDEITPVRAPVDGCGAPLPAAADAYATVELHRVLVAREKGGTSTS